MGQQGGSRGPGNRDHEKEERNAHGAAAKIRDARPPPEEPGRDQRHANQENLLHDESHERYGLTCENESDRGHEPKAKHVQKGEEDQGPSRVPFEDRSDRHDGNRRRDSCHENPAVPDLGIRTQDRERKDEAAQYHIAHPERDEEPSELFPRRDSGNRNLGQGERHPEDEGDLRNLFRVRGKAARGETDDEARSHHLGEAAPWAEHGGPRWASSEKAAASEAREGGAHNREGDRDLLRHRHPLVHPEPSNEDRDDRIRSRQRHHDRDGTETDCEEYGDSSDAEQEKRRKRFADSDAIP